MQKMDDGKRQGEAGCWKKDLGSVTIETERLRLAPVSMEYAEAIFQEFTPEITRYMAPESPVKISQTIAFIDEAQSRFKAGTDLHMLILERRSGEFLGMCGLHNIGSRDPELGIWIKKSAHGNGFGYEAVAGLAGWARENVEFDEFIYPVSKANRPSRNIAEKLGGRVVREMVKKKSNNSMLEEVEYRIPR